MKKTMVMVLMGIVLTTGRLYAGNGDLVVGGNIGIGTTNPPASRLTISDVIPDSTWITGSQVQINDQPTNISGTSATFSLLSQPAVSADSTATYIGFQNILSIPNTSLKYSTVKSALYQSAMNGTGNLSQQTGAEFTVGNYSTGTIGQQSGLTGSVKNSGSVGMQKGIYAEVSNSGNIGDQYGMASFLFNSGTSHKVYGTSSTINNLLKGSIDTAYGLYTTITKIGTGGIYTGYGLYIDSVKATNKYSVYASDATAPSIFAGNVGIGSTAIPAYTLDVAGTIKGNNVSPSDIRLKENITPIESALEKVSNIRGVSFDWKRAAIKESNFPEGRHYGVIAQEIEKVLPEVVSTGTDDTKSVAYTEIIPVLIEAIKEQQKIIENQQAQIQKILSLINK